jgi:CDP-diacylglycerol--glycerol-3-phosphate 3-phosphatidyltransferase
MSAIWQSIIKGYLRLIEPVVALMVRFRVNPNVLTTVGTLGSVASGLAFAVGRVRLAGIIVGLCAIFDVLDGVVARRTNQSTVFGAFYDSTLDRVADGALLGGILYFYATHPVFGSRIMIIIALLALVGTFIISYTRARAEALGIDAKVGFMQRPERVVLTSVPTAVAGLAWNGGVLIAVVCILALSAWITAVQRILYVRRATETAAPTTIRVINEKKKLSARFASRRAQS